MHSTGKSTLTMRILPIYIMEVFRTINADAYAEVVIMKETAPFVVEQSAISLQRIKDTPTSTVLPL